MIKLIRDNNPENPRNWDNQCRMICWHNHLGNKHNFDRDAWMRELVFREDLDLEDYISVCARGSPLR